MKISKVILLLSIIFCGNLKAQSSANRTVRITLPVVALINVVPSDPIALKFTSSGEAGRMLVSPVSTDSKWINYSSAITPGGSSRVITAAISQEVKGIAIRLNTAAYSGSGGGTLGSAVNQVILSTIPVTIISGIGGAFTGIGINNGHKITFSAVVTNYKDLTASSNNIINVVYTISDF